jgi:hypothetical protein
MFRRPRHVVLLLLGSISLVSSLLTDAHAQTAAPNTWTVKIVLPSKVVAGRPATLAVLGVDGRLAPGVAVDLGNGQSVTTDRTGRAVFNVPTSGSMLLAKAPGTSAAALIDPHPDPNPQKALEVPGVFSLRDPVSICGPEFRGDADGNHVRINGEASLVMAASPECLSVLPAEKLEPGAGRISVIANGSQWAAQAKLVSLAADPPDPPLAPDKKGRLSVRVKGSEEKLPVIVENQTPGVVRFLKGDVQRLLTTGGSNNSAEVVVEAVRSGNFLFNARLLTVPDADVARRYLLAAQQLAPTGMQRDVTELANKLNRAPGHPRDFDQVQRALDRMLTVTIDGDFRTLLDAARRAL